MCMHFCQIQLCMLLTNDLLPWAASQRHGPDRGRESGSRLLAALARALGERHRGGRGRASPSRPRLFPSGLSRLPLTAPNPASWLSPQREAGEGGRGGSRGAGAAPLGGYRTDLAREKDRALCASLGGKGVLLSRRPYGPGRSAEAQRGLPGGDRGASFRGTRDAQCWARCYSLSLTCRTTPERALSAPTGVRGARCGRKSINVPVAAVSQARGWLGTRPTRPISLDLGGDPWAAPVSRARGPEIWSATGRAA